MLRNPFFDNAKVILIFLVVLGHFIEINKGSLGEDVYWLIYSFHMPAFIFIAGYFSKKESWKETFRKAISQFLIPYLFFQATFNYVTYFWFNNHNVDNFTTANFALWFLLSMIFWKVSLQIIIRWKWTLLLFFGLFLTHRFWIDDLRFLSIGRSVSFCFFFYLGYFFKTKSSYFQKIDFSSLWTRSAGIIGLAVICFLYKLSVISIPVDWFRGVFYPFELTSQYSVTYLMLYQMYVICFSLIMMILFFMMIPKKEYSWTSLGKATMSVYLLHVFVRHWVVKEGLTFSYDSFGHILAGSALSLVVVYILSQPPFYRFIDFICQLPNKIMENKETKQ